MSACKEVDAVLDQGERMLAGLTYMYWKDGLPSFVLDVRTTTEIDEALLNRAIADALERHPYFAVRAEERDGDYYVVRNDEPLIAHRTDGFIPLGGHSNNYHLLGVTYSSDSVKLSMPGARPRLAHSFRRHAQEAAWSHGGPFPRLVPHQLYRSVRSAEGSVQ